MTFVGTVDDFDAAVRLTFKALALQKADGSDFLDGEKERIFGQIIAFLKQPGHNSAASLYTEAHQWMTEAPARLDNRSVYVAWTGGDQVAKRVEDFIKDMKASGGRPGQSRCGPNAARLSSPIWWPTRRCARPTSTPPPLTCAAASPMR
jgi:hypothetical protein